MRRIGRFSIDSYIIENDPKQALAVLAGCLVVRAEMMFYIGAVEYVALNNAFDEVDNMSQPPYYTALIKQIDRDTVVFDKWVRR